MCYSIWDNFGVLFYKQGVGIGRTTCFEDRYPCPDNSRVGCSDRGYGRPSGRPRVSHPATYYSSTPRMRDPAVARWQAHLHGLATPSRELSGLDLNLRG